MRSPGSAPVIGEDSRARQSHLRHLFTPEVGLSITVYSMDIRLELALVGMPTRLERMCRGKVAAGLSSAEITGKCQSSPVSAVGLSGGLDGCWSFIY